MRRAADASASDALRRAARRSLAAALPEIVDVAMKWSRNIYAETLLLAIGAPRRASDRHARFASACAKR